MADENGQVFDINLDAPLEVSTDDMVVRLDGEPGFHYNDQIFEAGIMTNSFRFEMEGFIAGHYIYTFQDMLDGTFFCNYPLYPGADPRYSYAKLARYGDLVVVRDQGGKVASFSVRKNIPEDIEVGELIEWYLNGQDSSGIFKTNLANSGQKHIYISNFSGEVELYPSSLDKLYSVSNVQSPTYWYTSVKRRAVPGDEMTFTPPYYNDPFPYFKMYSITSAYTYPTTGRDTFDFTDPSGEGDPYGKVIILGYPVPAVVYQILHYSCTTKTGSIENGSLTSELVEINPFTGDDKIHATVVEFEMNRGVEVPWRAWKLGPIDITAPTFDETKINGRVTSQKHEDGGTDRALQNVIFSDYVIEKKYVTDQWVGEQYTDASGGSVGLQVNKVYLALSNSPMNPNTKELSVIGRTFQIDRFSCHWHSDPANPNPDGILSTTEDPALFTGGDYGFGADTSMPIKRIKKETYGSAYYIITPNSVTLCREEILYIYIGDGSADWKSAFFTCGVSPHGLIPGDGAETSQPDINSFGWQHITNANMNPTTGKFTFTHAPALSISLEIYSGEATSIEWLWYDDEKPVIEGDENAPQFGCRIHWRKVIPLSGGEERIITDIVYYPRMLFPSNYVWDEFLTWEEWCEATEGLALFTTISHEIYDEYTNSIIKFEAYIRCGFSKPKWQFELVSGYTKKIYPNSPRLIPRICKNDLYMQANDEFTETRTLTRDSGLQLYMEADIPMGSGLLPLTEYTYSLRGRPGVFRASTLDTGVLFSATCVSLLYDLWTAKKETVPSGFTALPFVLQSDKGYGKTIDDITYQVYVKVRATSNFSTWPEYYTDTNGDMIDARMTNCRPFIMLELRCSTVFYIENVRTKTSGVKRWLDDWAWDRGELVINDYKPKNSTRRDGLLMYMIDAVADPGVTVVSSVDDVIPLDQRYRQYFNWSLWRNGDKKTAATCQLKTKWYYITKPGVQNQYLTMEITDSKKTPVFSPRWSKDNNVYIVGDEYFYWDPPAEKLGDVRKWNVTLYDASTREVILQAPRIVSAGSPGVNATFTSFTGDADGFVTGKIQTSVGTYDFTGERGSYEYPEYNTYNIAGTYVNESETIDDDGKHVFAMALYDQFVGKLSRMGMVSRRSTALWEESSEPGSLNHEFYDGEVPGFFRWYIGSGDSTDEDNEIRNMLHVNIRDVLKDRNGPHATLDDVTGPGKELILPSVGEYTLEKVVALYDQPVEGAVIINDRDVTRQSYWAVSDRITLAITDSTMIAYVDGELFDSVPLGDIFTKSAGTLYQWGVSSAVVESVYPFIWCVFILDGKMRIYGRQTIQNTSSPLNYPPLESWTKTDFSLYRAYEVEGGAIPKANEITIYSPLTLEQICTGSVFSATTYNGKWFIGIKYDRGIHQWTLNFGNSTQVITGFGSVGPDGLISGGIYPTKFIDPAKGFTGLVYSEREDDVNLNDGRIVNRDGTLYFCYKELRGYTWAIRNNMLIGNHQMTNSLQTWENLYFEGDSQISIDTKVDLGIGSAKGSGTATAGYVRLGYFHWASVYLTSATKPFLVAETKTDDVFKVDITKDPLTDAIYAVLGLVGNTTIDLMNLLSKDTETTVAMLAENFTRNTVSAGAQYLADTDTPIPCTEIHLGGTKSSTQLVLPYRGEMRIMSDIIPTVAPNQEVYSGPGYYSIQLVRKARRYANTFNFAQYLGYGYAVNVTKFIIEGIERAASYFAEGASGGSPAGPIPGVIAGAIASVAAGASVVYNMTPGFIPVRVGPATIVDGKLEESKWEMSQHIYIQGPTAEETRVSFTEASITNSVTIAREKYPELNGRQYETIKYEWGLDKKEIELVGPYSAIVGSSGPDQKGLTASGEPVFSEPGMYDACVFPAYKVYVTFSGDTVIHTSVKDVKVFDGPPSNMVVENGSLYLASPYVVVKVSDGIVADLIRPVAMANGLMTHNTGYNFFDGIKPVHAFDGYGNRIISWVGSMGGDVEKITPISQYLNANTARTVHSIFPPSAYFGAFTSAPTVDYQYPVTMQVEGMKLGPVTEDTRAYRVSLPLFFKKAATFPVGVQTIAGYKLLVTDGLTSLTTDTRTTDIRSFSTASDFFILGKVFRQSEEYLSPMDQQFGALDVKDGVPAIGLKSIGTYVKDAWFYTKATRNFWRFNGSNTLENFMDAYRIADVGVGEREFIKGYMALPVKFVDGRERVIRYTDKPAGTITGPHEWIVNPELVGTAAGLVFQGQFAEWLDPYSGIMDSRQPRAQVVQHTYDSDMYGFKTADVNGTPYWKKGDGFFDERVYDQYHLPDGWRWEPFRLMTAWWGLNDNTDCLFEWNITFALTKWMIKLIGDKYVSVSIQAETAMPGGHIMGERLVLKLARMMFNRKNDGIGYYSFKFTSRNGAGNAERLYIWSDGLMALRALQCVVKPVTTARTMPLLTGPDYAGMVEL
jgi:hypothetical protein